MGLFRKLFGRQEQAPADPEVDQAEPFDADWHQTVARFSLITGQAPLDLKLFDPQTKEPIAPYTALAETFDHWQQITTPYDRRRLLLERIYDMVWRSMSPCHTANHLVAIRRPDAALGALEEAGIPEPEDADYAACSAALARALTGMTRYKEALAWAQEAVATAPDDYRFQTVLADAFHLNGDPDEAHALYSRLMTASSNASSANIPVSELFAQLFALETGCVPSPVFALELGCNLTDPTEAEEFWRLAETEFYDSPYFREQLAYHLARTGDRERSFVKLMALVKEMPWLREASLNLEEYFLVFDPTGAQILPEFQTSLRRTILENGWLTDERMPS